MSPPTKNQVTTVPKRRPPRPHSCNRSRSPRRQRAAANPSQVMKPNSRTKTTNAIPFTCGTTLPLETLCALSRFPGGEIDHGREHRADAHPEKLKPVEEGDTEQRWLRLVIERRPENHEELHDEEQVPPTPFPAFTQRTVLCGHRRNVYG